MTYRPLKQEKRTFKPPSSGEQAGGRRFNVQALGKRARGLGGSKKTQYLPPEDWYEPTGRNDSNFDVVVQQPGPGFEHVVTQEEVRARLEILPKRMLEPLEVVQLSRMTRKKRRFPCYGMQWGSTLYLYPIDVGLTEYYGRPPKPAQVAEATMFGGKWIQESPTSWKLVWTRQAIRDFYLNNILIHELGHLLDDRNTSYVDRERYAEWFALEHGYKSNRRSQLAKRGNKTRRVRRRHHSL